MKTFLRENKLRLLLLGAPVLCLIVLWNINIYRIWYDSTPWKSFGSPPNGKAVDIGRIKFPDLDSPRYKIGNKVYYPPYFDKYYSRGPRPEIAVYSNDGNIFTLDWMGQWKPGEFPEYPNNERKWIEEERDCARKTRLLWALEEELDDNSKFIDSRGSCAYYSFDNYHYVVYKISQDGGILEKYINGEKPRSFRNWITFYICLFMILSAPSWTRLFIDFDYLKPKPDYGAK